MGVRACAGKKLELWASGFRYERLFPARVAPEPCDPSDKVTPHFQAKLAAHGLLLRRDRLETLQINVGRQCNQACRHCHVDAAPWRTETLDEQTARRLAKWIAQFRPAVVDLTGGAPELSCWF